MSAQRDRFDVGSVAVGTRNAEQFNWSPEDLLPLCKLERANIKRMQDEHIANTNLEIEKLKIAAQRDLAAQNFAAEERRRQHEIEVLDKQLELARLRQSQSL
ncbi:hypothetical protein BDN70DRAFT_895189 [Pholiota conissans]|uniref:Uncharacterized protein n=1 Tax=Pholiota conissans TaxID=109636 RepID=A0A9P5Z1K5_9AGAR|nr:hypothetical protein BDN70DRAFT_895189 [Pholiota conissans]